jgi:hypothetical protein
MSQLRYTQSNSNPNRKDVPMAESSTTHTEGRWTATMAAEDYEDAPGDGDKSATKKMTPPERMAALRARAEAVGRERAEQLAEFKKEFRTANFGEAGIPVHLQKIIKDAWLRGAAFRLKRQPDAWEIVSACYDALGDDEVAHAMLGDPWEALEAGFAFGQALARHDAEQGLQARENGEEAAGASTAGGEAVMEASGESE